MLRSIYNKMNSKYHASANVELYVLVVSIVLATAIGFAALQLAPALTGRLHPGLVPGALAVLAIAATLAVIATPRRPAGDAPVAGMPALACACLAAIILAYGLSRFGLLAAAAVSGAIAAFGVAGVRPGRALAIGCGLSLAVSAALALIQRQPLPILPPGLWR